MDPAHPIILVDDDEDLLWIAERGHKKSKLKTNLMSFTDGQQFLDFLEEVEQGARPKPSLVFLDINMPEINGIEVVRRIRSRPAFQQDLVVYMLSGSDREEDAEAAKAAGADAYIVKPTAANGYVELFDHLAQDAA